MSEILNSLLRRGPCAGDSSATGAAPGAAAELAAGAAAEVAAEWVSLWTLAIICFNTEHKCSKPSMSFADQELAIEMMWLHNRRTCLHVVGCASV